MFVLWRSLGESMVIGEGHTVTLSRADVDVAEVRMTDPSAPRGGYSIVLPRHEAVEVLPGVRLTYVEPHPVRPGARLGIVAPPEVPFYRKEVWDTIWGKP